MFKHFVLTRFNLKIKGYAAIDKNGHPVQTEEWLDRRFYLFENFCLPSLMNQTSKNFVWFVMFSNDTPAPYIERIKEIQVLFPLFKPLFLAQGENEDILKTLMTEVPKYLLSNDKYLITTRIDNDDAFHKDMISLVQSQFKSQGDVFLSFTYGLQYDLSSHILTRLHYENNHFISRIEKLSNGLFRTVITHDHTYIDQISEVIYIYNKTKPLWLEIIHDGNIINRLYPTAMPLFRNQLRDSFNFEEQISFYNTLKALLRLFKLKALISRAYVLTQLGIYDFLKTHVFKDKYKE